ncbi:MAG: YeiH family protein [Oligoflexales bacterium]
MHSISISPTKRSFILAAGVAVSLFPFVSPGGALLAGIVSTIILRADGPTPARKFGPLLLKTALVGLGASINFRVIASLGWSGFLATLSVIVSTLILGWLVSGFLSTRGKAGLLITVGTAICGGSAIAAVAPIIDAKNEETSVALTTIFLLNAVALYVFPLLGAALNLSQEQFGFWSALAIHDTSSVVGSAMAYGDKALATATTVKLMRALWIVPFALAIGYFYRQQTHEQQSSAKVKTGVWFLWGFVGMSILATAIPELGEVWGTVSLVAKRLLVASLFLIGASVNLDAFRKLGMKPALMGVILWFCLGTGVLGAILILSGSAVP